MNQRVRCIVFDFDGVLVDSNRIKRAAYFDAFAEVPGAARAVDECLAFLPDGDRRDIIACIVDKVYAPAERLGRLESYVQEYGHICDEQLVACAETHGASAVLGALVGVYSLYVNSATPEPSLRDYVALRGWTRHFRQTLGRPNSKPANLEIIRRAEAVASQEIVFVGDRQSDLAAARAANCRFLAVRSDGNDFTEPVEMIDDLTFLPAHLQALELRPC
jgi:phosphoglycolate phosphatase-like HAD superfamily hydrolase